MRKVKIITDSCADLTAEQLSKYNIDYAKMSTVYEGKETPAKLTWTPDEAHELYNIMRDGNRITTAQVSVEEFNRVFEIYLMLDMDIVYIGCSSKQSGSVNTGFVTAKKLMEKYEGSTIICIDSLNASMGEGMLAIEAAKLANDGASATEIEAHILAIRKKVNQYVTVHSLDALKRAGRVKGSAAFFGNLMGVKPIIIADANGDQAAYKKVKGRQKSFEEIVAMLKASIIEPEKQTIYMTHADCAKEEIDGLVALIKQEIPCLDVEVGYIGPIIGASIGPDAVGIWGFGQEVTYKIGD
ncbi:MAG: DegV family protein [Ruminococcaceae bacterium]|nr:DegV family protein [Oscillospiraceae bacterium]